MEDIAAAEWKVVRLVLIMGESERSFWLMEVIIAAESKAL